jgi:hypothetical protein
MDARQLLSLVTCAAVGCGAPTVGVDRADAAAESATDAPPGPESLAFEIWDPWLAERDPLIDARRAAILEAIAADTSDVVCLSLVFRDSDKKAIAEAARARFPYSYWAPTHFDTVVTDVAGVHGVEPPPYTTPPCGPSSWPALDRALACLQSACDDGTGHLTEVGCPTTRCLVELTTLGDADPRCAACSVTALADESFEDGRKQCTENVRGDLAFRGQNGQLLLSRRPLREASFHPFPTTSVRTGVVRASITAGTAPLDVYCTGAPIGYLAQYYAGPYRYMGFGSGVLESMLVTSKIIDQVRAGTPSGRAVLLAWHGDTESIKRRLFYGPAGFLRANFAEGTVLDGPHECTFCRDNELMQGSVDLQPSALYLHGIDRIEVTATDRTYMDKVVVSGGKTYARSIEYGLRSFVTLR